MFTVYSLRFIVSNKHISSSNHRITELSNHSFLCFLPLIFLLSIASAFSQTLSYSIPEKLSTKTPEFRILGKNREGVLIYKYGKDSHTVEAYGNNLSMRWEKSFSFKQPEANVKRLVVYPEKTLVFYLSDQKGVPVLFAEKWNSKFTGDGNAMPVDTIIAGKFDVESTLRIAPSQNQAVIACYYPTGTDNDEQLMVTLTDSELRVTGKKQIAINRDGDNLLLRKVFPDNAGNVYVLLEDDEKSKKKHSSPDAFIVKMHEASTGAVREIDFKLQHPVFKKIYLDFDNVNKNLVATGFYTDDTGEEAKGFFYSAYNIDSGYISARSYTKFTPELIFEITGKDTSKNSQGFYSFEVYDLIMRFDGGAIIIAESRFSTEENMQVPSFTPSIGPSFRTIQISYYNDIMVISVNADGTPDWTKVLKKKQISEDDEGFFSSYCMATMGSKLHFIFNEEIYQKTNVSEYHVDKTGGSERKHLFNAGDRNVLLVPKLGKQISSNEVIIPSYKRNLLGFVKVTY